MLFYWPSIFLSFSSLYFFLFTMFYTNPWRNVHTSCWLSKGRVIVEVKNVNLNISVFRSLIWCLYHCVHLLLHGVKKKYAYLLFKQENFIHEIYFMYALKTNVPHQNWHALWKKLYISRAIHVHKSKTWMSGFCIWKQFYSWILKMKKQWTFFFGSWILTYPTFTDRCLLIECKFHCYTYWCTA